MEIFKASFKIQEVYLIPHEQKLFPYIIRWKRFIHRYNRKNTGSSRFGGGEMTMQSTEVFRTLKLCNTEIYWHESVSWTVVKIHSMSNARSPDVSCGLWVILMYWHLSLVNTYAGGRCWELGRLEQGQRHTEALRTFCSNWPYTYNCLQQ